ncbi:MAG: 5'-methylthioadenosine/adenosylhomocysteine nucleosidase [Lachnospiraceae bacterium]|nr:5'-methylthioadenosine/adenosylhomocysteine nucleosidase [Lachnospiraceae bacterium]
MKIGIIGAMEIEVETLKEAMTIEETVTRANMEFCVGKLEKKDVIVVRSGVGKVNAALCTQILIDVFQAEAIINTGVAGSLHNAINIGDIVVSTDAVYHDVDATVFGYQKGEVPQMGRLSFPADLTLQKKAMEAIRKAAPDCNVFAGRIASGDQFVAGRNVKEGIAKTMQAQCTEMEGAAIAHAAYVNGVPFVILRAISDKADESVQISYDDFEKKAAQDCAAITKELVKHM